MARKTQAELRNESLNIIYQLKKDGYTSKDKAIYRLLELLTAFVETGFECNIDIPYPEANKTIMGTLYADKGKPSVVFLRDNVTIPPN